MYESFFEDFPETWDVDYRTDDDIHIIHNEYPAAIRVEWDELIVTLWEDKGDGIECLFGYATTKMERASVISKQLAQLFDELR